MAWSPHKDYSMQGIGQQKPIFGQLGVYYEPQYAKARKLLAKFIATITPYDDTFDNYGIWEELQPFADVMQRFAILFFNNQILEATVFKKKQIVATRLKQKLFN